MSLAIWWWLLPAGVAAPNIEECLSKLVAVRPALSRPAATASERSRDRELLERIAAGDIDALRVLYDEHAPRALAIANRILRDTTEAEDIVQETFLELWRRASQFDAARGGAVAWIVTITRSRAIDRLRTAGTAGRTLEGVATSPELLGAAAFSGTFAGPGEQIERRRDERRVAAALAALPEAQRRTIELAYFEGLSQSEIATRTESPLGTVKMRVKLAMAKLTVLLKEQTA